MRLLKAIIIFLKKEKLLSILLLLYLVTVVLTKGNSLNIERYVDWNSIFMITSILLVSRSMECSGVFTMIAEKLISLSRGSFIRLTTFIILAAAFSAMILMNDASLFIYVPIVLALSRISNVDLPLLLTILTISVNIGSALTPIGNPQNIIIWQYYGISFIDFISALAFFFVVSLALLFAYSIILLKAGRHLAELRVKYPERVSIDKVLFILASILLIIDVFLGEEHLSYLALLISFITLLIVRREIMLSIDYVLIAVFILMFADFRALSAILSGYKLIPIFKTKLMLFYWGLLLSQIVSNVPATILLLNHTRDWVTLAVSVNLGGVGFVTGSLANIITLRLGGLKVRDFHKYSLPYFVLLVLLFTLFYLVVT